MTPLTTNDNVICPHNGKVVLNSHYGSRLTINHSIKAITKKDLLNAQIVGCTRTVAGIKTPCEKVASVEGVSCLLNINNDDVVLCEKLNLSLSDKGFPLSLVGKAFLQDKVNIQ